MFKRACSRALAALALSLGLTACTGVPPVSEKAIAYNEEVAQATNRIFLLNTLRASERLPLYYTRITTLQGEGVISPKIGAPIDFGPRASDIIRLAAEIGASQKDTVAISVLDDQKFLQGVLTPISGKLIGFYLDEGWPPELVLHLALERIEADGATLQTLSAYVRSACENNPRGYCTKLPLDASLKLCASLGPVFDNAPLRARERSGNGPTKFECFQTVLRALLVLNLSVREGTRLKLETDVVDASAANLANLLSAADKGFAVAYAGGKASLCKKLPRTVFALSSNSQRIALQSADASGEPADACEAQNRDASSKNTQAKLAITIVTRSPDAMIYYLGEVVKKGLEDGKAITVLREAEDAVYPRGLFVVEDGGGSDALVTVSFDGHSYSIPRPVDDPAPGDEWKNHRSMQTMAFVNQAFGLLKEAAIPPTIPSITVLPN